MIKGGRNTGIQLSPDKRSVINKGGDQRSTKKY